MCPACDTVKYRKGADNPADILSRMPIPSTTSKPNVTDHYVKFVAAHAVPKAMTMAEIEKATANDETMQDVIQSFQQTQWDTSDIKLRPYERLCDELSITESWAVLPLRTSSSHCHAIQYMKPLNKAIIDPLNFREKTGDVSFTYFYLLIEKHHIPQLHGEVPPELLFNRVVRSGIPSVNENSVFELSN
jgi:hypothetical protein